VEGRLSTSWRTGSRKSGRDKSSYNLQRLAPRDPLPPVRPQLLKFPQLPKIAPATGEHEPVGKVSFSNHNSLYPSELSNSMAKVVTKPRRSRQLAEM
jgi:hypothetical protein